MSVMKNWLFKIYLPAGRNLYQRTASYTKIMLTVSPDVPLHILRLWNMNMVGIGKRIPFYTIWTSKDDEATLRHLKKLKKQIIKLDGIISI